MDYTKPFKYISEIEKNKSISLAAEKLNMQQPALSKYLKKTETELGIELFDRSVSPISLTEAGKCYIETAKKIIDADKQLHKHILEIKSNNVDIVIGISPSRAPYLLPEILKKYSATTSKSNITIVEGTTDELSAGLINGHFDLIISLADNTTKIFEKEFLFTESIVLAVPIDCKYRTFYDVFNNFNIIASGKGQLMSNVLESMPKHTTPITCQNMITSISLVKAGIGAALLPSYMASYGDSSGIRFLKIPGEYLSCVERDVCVFYRREQFLSSSERSFITCSKEVAADKNALII